MDPADQYTSQARETMRKLEALREERIEQVTSRRIHPVALFEFDGSCILTPSLGFKRILRFQSDLINGVHVYDLVHPHDHADLLTFAELGQAEEDSESTLRVELLVRFRCQDGSYRWLLWHSLGYKTSDPEQSGHSSLRTFSCAAIDVTDSVTLGPLIDAVSDQRKDSFEKGYE